MLACESDTNSINAIKKHDSIAIAFKLHSGITCLKAENTKRFQTFNKTEKFLHSKEITDFKNLFYRHVEDIDVTHP